MAELAEIQRHETLRPGGSACQRLTLYSHVKCRRRSIEIDGTNRFVVEKLDLVLTAAHRAHAAGIEFVHDGVSESVRPTQLYDVEARAACRRMVPGFKFIGEIVGANTEK